MIYNFKLKGTNQKRNAYAVDVFLQTDEKDPKTIKHLTDIVFYKDKGFLDPEITGNVDAVSLKLMNSDCAKYIKNFETYL